MNLLRSRLLPKTPWQHLITAGLLAIMLPCALGVAGLIVFYIGGNLLQIEAALFLWMSSTALMLSPFLSMAGMILALPIAAVLLRKGWFGWLPAAGLGLTIGALIGAISKFEPGTAIGLCILLMLRWLLGRFCPLSVA